MKELKITKNNLLDNLILSKTKNLLKLYGIQIISNLFLSKIFILMNVEV